ncbi:MAG: PQQ-like beta-propeller repeat protein [Bryobacteraceae bacterium]|nr:PQQ-like beta-propeller repeat protein [Bryobacteraceae bacterium]MDW8379790.1 PQQ-binding-like beta-propeller repeat protein [Bryobacterales bacterium]
MNRPSPYWLIATILFLPPVGLVLLWLRPQLAWWKKFLGTLAIFAATLFHLVVVFGMRIELGGGGRPAFVHFGKVEQRRAEAVERNRAEQAKVGELAAGRLALEQSAAPPGSEVPASAAAKAVPPPPESASTETQPAYWTDFRGPRRDGVYPREILTSWPAKGLPLLWKQPIGGGYASFVVGEGRAYTIEQRRDKEVIAAYDLRTGRELWTHAYEAHFQESLGGNGPRATPTYHEGLVYALGATGEFRVLEARTGALRWKKNILADNGAQNLTWGICGAPLIVDEKVIVQTGGVTGKTLVAYHKITGERIWSSLNDQGAYASPMLVNLGGRRHIVTMMAKRAVGVAVEDGRLLWDYPWETQYDVNAAQPLVVGPNRLLISSGYGHGAAVIELSSAGEVMRATRIWENNRLKNRFNSSVLHEGYVYGLDENILACVRASDGQLMWKGGRYGYGQLLLASGHLVLISEEGDLVLIRATPEKHEELAKFEAIQGKTWNVPIIENGVLLVRNTSEMAAFRIGK